MGEEPAFAAIQQMLFEGTCYLTPIWGALLADSSWGRYKTILVFSVIYLVVGLHHSAWSHVCAIHLNNCAMQGACCPYRMQICSPHVHDWRTDKDYILMRSPCIFAADCDTFRLLGLAGGVRHQQCSNGPHILV